MHVNSSPCLKTDQFALFLNLCVTKRMSLTVNFIRLNEKIRRKLNICCLVVMEPVKAANI